MAERKIIALQRFIKRVCEREIFTSLIRQAGFPQEGGLSTELGHRKSEFSLDSLIDYLRLALPRKFRMCTLKRFSETLSSRLRTPRKLSLQEGKS